MIKDVLYLDDFIDNSMELFEDLRENTDWDERMLARKTASFGVAYNYSDIFYPDNKMPKSINEIAIKLQEVISFLPNNCLINYYLDGKSKMGYHSDQTDILFENTGIAIISLGETREIIFRNKENKENKVNYQLKTGSLLYMTQEVQEIWQHSIPKNDTNNGRISLTFRKIKE